MFEKISHTFVLILLGACLSGCIFHSPLPDKKQVIIPVSADNPQKSPDARVVDIEGRPCKLSQLHGKMILLNFFAVWCKSCVYELSTLSNLSEELKDSGLLVVALSVDEDRATFQRFATEHASSVLYLHDEYGEAKERFNITGLPVTFTLDRELQFLNFLDPRTKRKKLRVDGFETWDSKYIVSGFKRYLDGVP